MSRTASSAAPHALARLVHFRWALPVLAQVAKREGCKLVTLRQRLGVSPLHLRRALSHLAALDLVVPNPGFGHPLRPEYVLGELGMQVGLPAVALWEWMQRAEFERTMLKKWSLPTMAAVGLGARRFGEIRSLLVDATPRATTLALKDLIALDVATRHVDEGFPPTPRYALFPSTILLEVYALGEPLVLGFASVANR